jgi:hypothetical protein
MLAATDFQGIAILVAAIGSSITAILSALNRRQLSGKPANGDRNWFGRPRRRTIGDVIVLLEQANTHTIETDEKVRALDAKVEALLTRDERRGRSQPTYPTKRRRRSDGH